MSAPNGTPYGTPSGPPGLHQTISWSGLGGGVPPPSPSPKKTFEYKGLPTRLPAAAPGMLKQSTVIATLPPAPKAALPVDLEKLGLARAQTTHFPTPPLTQATPPFMQRPGVKQPMGMASPNNFGVTTTQPLARSATSPTLASLMQPPSGLGTPGSNMSLNAHLQQRVASQVSMAGISPRTPPPQSLPPPSISPLGRLPGQPAPIQSPAPARPSLSHNTSDQTQLNLSQMINATKGNPQLLNQLEQILRKQNNLSPATMELIAKARSGNNNLKASAPLKPPIGALPPQRVTPLGLGPIKSDPMATLPLAPMTSLETEAERKRKREEGAPLPANPPPPEKKKNKFTDIRDHDIGCAIVPDWKTAFIGYSDVVMRLLPFHVLDFDLEELETGTEEQAEEGARRLIDRTNSLITSFNERKISLFDVTVDGLIPKEESFLVQRLEWTEGQTEYQHQKEAEDKLNKARAQEINALKKQLEEYQIQKLNQRRLQQEQELMQQQQLHHMRDAIPAASPAQSRDNQPTLLSQLERTDSFGGLPVSEIKQEYGQARSEIKQEYEAPRMPSQPLQRHQQQQQQQLQTSTQPLSSLQLQFIKAAAEKSLPPAAAAIIIQVSQNPGLLASTQPNFQKAFAQLEAMARQRFPTSTLPPRAPQQAQLYAGQLQPFANHMPMHQAPPQQQAQMYTPQESPDSFLNLDSL